jgi:CubicO group peptidase (beta-lactamase class C family)
MLVAVRNSDMAFAGFGSITDSGNKSPDADTMFRIGSISKVFCGEVLASMALDGKLRFSHRLQDRLGYDVTLPEKAGHPTARQGAGGLAKPGWSARPEPHHLLVSPRFFEARRR